MQPKLWWPKPQAGDIAWCHFPELPALQPAPKPRPALVVRVFEDDPPHFRVLVAYGTSQKTRSLRRGEFLIASNVGEPYLLSGLSFDTKFNLGAVVELDYSSEWFKVPPAAPFGQKPKLGLLHASLMRSFQAAWTAVNS
jgi:hypothetical protein